MAKVKPISSPTRGRKGGNMTDETKTLLEEADQLLAEIKKSREDFEKKTSKIFAHANKIAQELEEMNLDEELTKIEREAVKEMDKIVLEFLSDEEEEKDGD